MTDSDIISMRRFGLFQLDRMIDGNRSILGEFSRILPGWIHLNCPDTFGLIWMSGNMENELHVGSDEAMKRGPVFLDEITSPKTKRHVIPRLSELIREQDEHRVAGFIQLIRVNKREVYQPYLTCAKFSETLNCIICQTLPVKESESLLRYTSKWMEWNEIQSEYFTKFQSLTKREKEILRLIALGHGNNYIGDLLYISPLTVKTHRRNICQKLETHRLYKLIRIAEAFRLL